MRCSSSFVKCSPAVGAGGGAGDAGIDRLIALAVGKLLADIGRKRHFAEALEQLEEDPLIVELHQAVAALLLGRDRRGERAVAERELRTGVQLAARLGKAFPDAAALVLQEQQLHGSARSGTRWPSRRAGSTRESFITRASPGCR